MELQACLSRWADRNGAVLAVDDGQTSLSYRALVRQARDVAADLQVLTGEGRPLLIEVAPTVAGATLLCAALLAGVRFCPMEPEEASRLSTVSLPEALHGHPLVRLTDRRTMQVVPRRTDEKIGKGGGVLEGVPACAVLQLTSGTTALRKVAVQPYASLQRGAGTYCRLWQIAPQSRVLVMVPIALSFGMIGGLLAAWQAGATAILMPHPSLKRAWREILAPGTATVLASPLHYLTLARMAKRRGGKGEDRLQRSTAFLSSGAALSDDAANAFRDLLACPVRQIYGSTETGLMTAVTEADPPWRLGLVGSSAPGVEIRIAAADGAPADAGGEGQVHVRTPTMFCGYLTPQCLERTIGPFDFWPTGDLGQMDAEGRLMLRGRVSTFVNVGGRKVHPETVETVLCGHPQVRQALVYGEPCSRLGQRLAADVVVAPATSLDAIIEHCRVRLPAYQVPQLWRLVDRLETTSTGKVKRNPRQAPGSAPIQHGQ